MKQSFEADLRRYGMYWLALKSQDDILRDFLDNMRVEIGKRGEYDEGWNTFEKIEFLLPENISNSFAKSIKTLLIEGTTDNWLEFYGRLKLYLQEHKDTYPSLEVTFAWLD